MLDRSHDEAMAEQLRADPSYALALLMDVLIAGSPEEQAIVLRQIAAAFGPD
ncbi:transcriptional regulator [Pseudomonas sp. MWU13-2625]|jgi:DNA-binding phage protein|nr:transcriptional regulator [Pseudomonas sp. MWU13-2625]